MNCFATVNTLKLCNIIMKRFWIKARRIKAVALKSTIALLKQKAYKNSECLAEAPGILKKSYLRNENLAQGSNIMRFGEMILYHTKECEIQKSNHNINVFILKAHYVQKTSWDQPFDCSMDFSKNARKVVTSNRKAISSFDLSLEKHFDQIYSIPFELISLIGLVTENNSSSRNAWQSTLTIARLLFTITKKEPINVKAQST